MSTTSFRRPATFEEFSDLWRKKLETLSADMYLRGQDIEDCVAGLLEEFWRRDYLNIYDPAKGAFSTFVYGFAKPRILGFRAKMLVGMRRTAVEIDALEEFQLDTELGDTTDWQKPSDHIDVVHGLRERLAKLSNPAGAQFSHLVIFDLMYAQAQQGNINLSDIAYHLGISPAAMTGYRKRLQAVMASDSNICALLKQTGRWEILG